ncbi:MAG: hypothetical protein CM1200mP16_03720 [Nitrospina sp.]|nr:MAG: hypothetical protein CM1200mP16_03720 [Nitrospina sp.]
MVENNGITDAGIEAIWNDNPTNLLRLYIEENN